MKRNFLLACCLASLASGAAAAATDVVPAARLSAAQIIERNVDARGGLAALARMSGMTLSGDMDAGGKHNTTLPFVLSMKRPNKTRLEIRFFPDPDRGAGLRRYARLEAAAVPRAQ